jgi:putative Holliday junction resolvase
MAVRVLGLDFGEKRIGVAVSDELGFTSQGLETIARTTRARDLEAVRDAASRHSCGAIVVGLPRNMDGSLGKAASAARRFADEVRRATGLPVELVDERMTTLMANRALIEAGERRTSRKSHVDRVAAQLILQGYLDSLRPKQENDGPKTDSSADGRLGAEDRGENKRA